MSALKARSKLTVADAQEIFRCKESLLSAVSVSRKYGVTEKAIRDIWTGRTWLKETGQLGTNLSLQLKKIGRPLGRKDAKPRKQRFSRFPAQNSENMTTFSPCPPTVAQVAPPAMNAVKSQPLMRKYSEDEAAAHWMAIRPCYDDSKNSIDDLLYEMSLRYEIDGDFQDPFGHDWVLSCHSLQHALSDSEQTSAGVE